MFLADLSPREHGAPKFTYFFIFYIFYIFFAPWSTKLNTMGTKSKIRSINKSQFHSYNISVNPTASSWQDLPSVLSE